MIEFSISGVNVDISIIIVNFNTCDLLGKCIRSILTQERCGIIEIIVVDNQSTDGSVAMVTRFFPSVRIIQNRNNAGFSKANNQGLAMARGDHVFFLNPDTELCPDCLSALLDHMRSNPSTGAAGPRTFIDEALDLEVCSLKILSLKRALTLFTRMPFISRRSTLESIWNLDLALWQSTTDTQVEGIGGAGFFMRRELAISLGGMDERFFMGYEDTDLSARIRACNLAITIVARAHMIHWFGQAKKLDSAPPKKIYDWHAAPLAFLKKYSGSSVAVFFRALKLLDLLLPKSTVDDRFVTIQPNESAGHYVIKWNPIPLSRYLLEISNTPEFYDKFALVTRDTHARLPLSLFRRLATPNWFIRVVELDQPAWNAPLLQAKLALPSSQGLDKS